VLGYDSIHIETKINGQPAVIQLWRGWCQKFLGLQDFTGGVGAEVGVYRREPRRLRPTSLPFLPPEMERNVLQALKVLPEGTSGSRRPTSMRNWSSLS
jgi:hypothetical protein